MPLSYGVSRLFTRDLGGTDCIFVTGASTSSAETGSTTNSFGKIVFVRDSTLTSITSTQILNSTEWSSGTTIPAGTVLYAKVTKVKTKSGAFIMYKSE